MKLSALAFDFATAAHAGAVRKYTGMPYITHPIAVADIVRAVPHTDEMLAAAYLHDVVEDTDVTLDEIEDKFGREVAELVYWLTDTTTPEVGDRRTRKATYRAHLAGAPNAAKTIKLADLINNTESIVEHDPKFARVYLAEKAELLTVLEGGDLNLLALAKNILAEGWRTLGVL